MGAHPANHRLIERLGAAGCDVLRNFDEAPRSDSGDDQPRDQEYSNNAEESMSLEEVAEHVTRSEEHTSELQSPYDLVCRLLLEKKKQKYYSNHLTVIIKRFAITSNLYTLYHSCLILR